MNFEHTEDRRMMADSLNRFIAAQYDIKSRNQLAFSKAGHSLALYKQFAELGAIGALFPEAAGGLGGSGFDISVIFECLGRGLVQEPILGALVVGQALVKAGTPTQQETLADLINGDIVAAYAHDEPWSHYELHQVSSRATRNEQGWVLEGQKCVVPFGESANLLLVSARTAGHPGDAEGISLFLVPGDASGITKQAYTRMDGGRAAELTFNQVQVHEQALLGQAGQASALLEQIHGYAILALTAEALGAMEVTKEHTLDYLRTRKQFGKPIGSFQALQHRMAELLLEVEQARSAVINASAALDASDRRVREKALSAAKYTTGHIGTLVAEESIQMHGGIGLTWELPLPHYAKRLVMIDHQFGDEDHHLARFIQLSQS